MAVFLFFAALFVVIKTIDCSRRRQRTTDIFVMDRLIVFILLAWLAVLILREV